MKSLWKIKFWDQSPHGAGHPKFYQKLEFNFVLYLSARINVKKLI